MNILYIFGGNSGHRMNMELTTLREQCLQMFFKFNLEQRHLITNVPERYFLTLTFMKYLMFIINIKLPLCVVSFIILLQFSVYSDT